MLLATLLALGSAVLHAGWNLLAKRSENPLASLWLQFSIAALISGAGLAVLSVVGDPLPLGAWGWAALTGLVHVPYVLGLGWAYRHGDFSMAYPVARGGGALLAAVGGVAVLGDRLDPLMVTGILTIVAGLCLLAVGAPWPQVVAALVVAASIGTYTTIDAHASRTYEGVGYTLAVFVCIGVAVMIVPLTVGRGGSFHRPARPVLTRAGIGAVMAIVTYGLVLIAVRYAPVGYVAALRESSVLIGALVGWKVLGEGRGRVRLVASMVVAVGLVVLILGG